MNPKTLELLQKTLTLLANSNVRYSDRIYESKRNELVEEIQAFIKSEANERHTPPEPTTVPSDGVPRQDEAPKRVVLPIIKE